MVNSQFNPGKPFTVGGLEFTDIADAVDAAVAASKLKANGFSAQICQPLQKGFASYQGSCIAIAHFRRGVDLNELAADEDGVPDMYVRAQAFRAKCLTETITTTLMGARGLLG